MHQNAALCGNVLKAFVDENFKVAGYSLSHNFLKGFCPRVIRSRYFAVKGQADSENKDQNALKYTGLSVKVLQDSVPQDH